MILKIANMPCKLFILLILCCTSILNCRLETVIESDSLSVIHHFISPEFQHKTTLIILDLDNTCIEPAESQFGSDQWFSALVLELQKQGKTFAQAIEHVLPLSFATKHHLPICPVETITAQTIKQLQTTVMVLGLTARSPRIKECTHKSLMAIDIDFTQNQIYPHNFDLTNEYPITKHAAYYGGILYVSENHKGHILMQFLDQIKYDPHFIICVDDKLKNIMAIKEIAAQHAIDFVGIRFNRLDDKVKNFTLEHTHHHQKQFEEKYNHTITHFKQQLSGI